jgi:hypothetical protein
MVATNLALGLTLASVLIAAVAFVGAHNTPLRVPDMSRAGCLTSVLLLVVAIVVASTPPLSRLGTCQEVCRAVIEDPPANTDLLPPEQAEGVAAFNLCVRGSKANYVKALEEQAKGGPPAVEEDPEAMKARCVAWALERCSRRCFDGEEAAVVE